MFNKNKLLRGFCLIYLLPIYSQEKPSMREKAISIAIKGSIKGFDLLFPSMRLSLLSLSARNPDIDKKLFNLRSQNIRETRELDPLAHEFAKDTLKNKLSAHIIVRDYDKYGFVNNYMLLINQNNAQGLMMPLVGSLQERVKLQALSDEEYCNNIAKLPQGEQDVAIKFGVQSRTGALAYIEKSLNYHKGCLFHEMEHCEKNDPLHVDMINFALTGGLTKVAYNRARSMPIWPAKLSTFIVLQMVGQYCIKPLIQNMYSRHIEMRADNAIPNQKELLSAACEYHKVEAEFKQEEAKNATSMQKVKSYIKSWFNSHPENYVRALQFQKRLDALEDKK